MHPDGVGKRSFRTCISSETEALGSISKMKEVHCRLKTGWNEAMTIYTDVTKGSYDL